MTDKEKAIAAEEAIQSVAKKNPDAALAAITDPSPLTLSQVALLERVESPLLRGDTKDTMENLKALYVLDGGAKPSAVVKMHREGTLEDAASAWVDETFASSKEYLDRLVEVLNAVTAFWTMLPKAEKDGKDEGDGKVKKATASETDSSQN